MQKSPSETDLLTLTAIRAGLRAGRWTLSGLLAETGRRMAAADERHPHVWITRTPEADLEHQVRHAEDRLRKGERLPLLGVPVAVKDNIDVAGLPTTAACPEFAYTPDRSATAVQRLMDAGAIVVGKTNLDQFATGLVGTRSPYGACRSALHADYISGGSSSGSAVAVAAGIVPIALGTDTAGSGRIPAAFNNIVGLKPSRGLVSNHGVVPACRSLDCVSVFALNVDDAETVLDVIGAFNPADPYSRRLSLQTPPPGMIDAGFRFGLPDEQWLKFFGNGAYEGLYRASIETLRRLGGREVVIDFAPFAETARMLYGPWIAERVAGLRPFWEKHADAMFPVTRQIFATAERVDAVATFEALHQLESLKRRAEQQWTAMDVMVLPTAGTIYSQAEIAADPIGLNTNLGYYTNFVNLLDLCGVALPAGFTDSKQPFGVSLLAPAGGERIVNVIGRRFEQAMHLPLGAMSYRTSEALPSGSVDEKSAAAAPSSIETVRMAVVGAHLSGLPLNHQLTGPGGRLVWKGRTTPHYRLFALPNTSPPKPGMIRDSERHPAGIELEVWELPVQAFGQFVAAIPPPLGIGSIELEDGSWVKGFLCEPHALVGAAEITQFGGWRGFLASKS